MSGSPSVSFMSTNDCFRVASASASKRQSWVCMPTVAFLRHHMFAELVDAAQVPHRFGFVRPHVVDGLDPAGEKGTDRIRVARHQAVRGEDHARADIA